MDLRFPLSAFGFPYMTTRFLLWIDAVGGYLVCLGEEVCLGQPVDGAAVGRAAADVPILGDLSSRHARIGRDGEGYWIAPVRAVRLDGRELSGPAALSDGNRIELGDRVRLAFRRPHPLSITARLDFLSPHRTAPSSDAVLLMGETCLLGPSPNCHVVCRNWPRDVLLQRQGEKLSCRVAGDYEIDGRACRGRGDLDWNSRIVGEGFSLSLEPLATG